MTASITEIIRKSGSRLLSIMHPRLIWPILLAVCFLGSTAIQLSRPLRRAATLWFPANYTLELRPELRFVPSRGFIGELELIVGEQLLGSGLHSSMPLVAPDTTFRVFIHDNGAVIDFDIGILFAETQNKAMYGPTPLSAGTTLDLLRSMLYFNFPGKEFRLTVGGLEREAADTLAIVN